MKVFADNTFENLAISRVANALKDNSPDNIEFVDNTEEADLVVVYVYAHRRKIWWHVSRLLDQGKKYAIVQLVVRSTRNPNTEDWRKIWEGAEVVWSYYDLERYCFEDNVEMEFNFYYAPLGVDTKVFRPYSLSRTNKVLVGNNRDESVNECINAAEGNAYVMGQGISDEELALQYSRSEYVSGLRRTEGFEMPVLEGLMCGARPICYDRPHYRDWFGEHPIYIKEGDALEVTKALAEIFKKKPRPVGISERREIARKFDWRVICNEFWSLV